MRKVFLDNLPKHKGFGANKDKEVVDWKSSIGCMVEFIYDDIKGNIEIIDYFSNKQIVVVRYNDNTININTSSFLGCHIGRLLNKYTGDFKIKVGQTFQDHKRDLIITEREYKNRRKNNKILKCYKYKCNKCGWSDGWIEEYKLIDGADCSCCSGITAVLGINTIWDTDRWMVDLGVSEEDAKKHTKGSNKTIVVKCSDCGQEKKIKINNMYNNKSIGCICGDGNSYPEKFMSEMLKQLNISYIHQLSKVYFNWCDNYRYDFYLPEYNCIVETHGNQHYSEVVRFNITLKNEQEKDKNKKELALNNGINKYITIDCRKSDLKWIKNSILNSKLSNMFDLSKVDWFKCEEFALKNIVKEVCDYWNSKDEHETTADLAKIFNLGRSTVVRYLKDGSNLEWCDYSPKLEMRKSALKLRNI